jgi:chromosome segregation ATPase
MTKEQQLNDFLNKYPKEKIGYFSMILLFNDDLRLDLTQEQLAFLADLNLIQESDPEFADSILLGYLSKSMSDLIETDKEIKERIKSYLTEKSELEEQITEETIETIKTKYEQAYKLSQEVNEKVDKYKKELSDMLDEANKLEEKETKIHMDNDDFIR